MQWTPSQWTPLLTRVIAAAALVACGAVLAPAQTSVAASLFGAFNQSTSGNGTAQSPANAAGALLELRHISSPLFGYEVTYSYNRANQSLGPAGPVVYPAFCVVPGPCTYSTSTAAISSNANELTGDWVVSIKLANLRPFALAGAGLLMDSPTGGTVTTTTYPSGTALSAQTIAAAATSASAKAVLVYGAGLDWGLLPHIGLRLQYRGNLYKAPALAKAFSSTGAFMQTAEPAIGAYFNF